MSRRCYDSTTAADIPADAAIVAGYVDGLYRWSAADWARFPHAITVTIACFPGTVGAQVYDVETGDLVPSDVPNVLRRERAAGRNPTIYCNRSNYAAIIGLLAVARMAPPPIWLSTLDGARAWWPYVVAVQYAGAALLGKHYDLSEVADYWPGIDPATGADDMFTDADRAWIQTTLGAQLLPLEQSIKAELDAIKAKIDGLQSGAPAPYKAQITPLP